MHTNTVLEHSLLIQRLMSGTHWSLRPCRSGWHRHQLPSIQFQKHMKVPLQSTRTVAGHSRPAVAKQARGAERRGASCKPTPHRDANAKAQAPVSINANDCAAHKKSDVQSCLCGPVARVPPRQVRAWAPPPLPHPLSLPRRTVPPLHGFLVATPESSVDGSQSTESFSCGKEAIIIP